MKTFKLKELINKLEEMRTTPGISDNTPVKINIETELSKWE